jgi:predicted thioesterase
LTRGATACVTFDVSAGDTARALGSGDLDVLATPRLLAWYEAATCRAVDPFLDAGATTVGTRVLLQHLLATAVGGRVDVRAELVHVDGRLLRFEVAASDEARRLVGTGEVTRVVVDRQRFASRVPSPS